LATLRSIKIAVCGNFWSAIIYQQLARYWLGCKLLPELAKSARADWEIRRQEQSH